MCAGWWWGVRQGRGNEQIVVWPVDALYKSFQCKRQKKNLLKEVKQILAVVTGKEYDGNIIQAEYDLK